MTIPKILAKNIQKFVNKLGYEIWTMDRSFDEKDLEIMNEASQFTFTNRTDMKCLIDAVRYIELNQISGCFVECGVWKGGSIVTMIKTLQSLSSKEREIYLFDTFEGMKNPTSHDIAVGGQNALKMKWEKQTFLEVVKDNVFKTGYDKSKLHFIKGEVEKTLPDCSIDKIVLLRLDTDWYESTKCELEYLFPKLVPGGILIIDDYGRWLGSKKAADDYFEKNKICIFLNKIFPSGAVIGVKST